MIKSVSTFITQYLRTNNTSLTEKDTLKIQYTLEVVLGDLSKFIIIFLIFFNVKGDTIILIVFYHFKFNKTIIGRSSL